MRLEDIASHIGCRKLVVAEAVDPVHTDCTQEGTEEDRGQSHQHPAEAVANLVALHHKDCSCFAHYTTVAVSSLPDGWGKHLADSRDCMILVRDPLRIDLSVVHDYFAQKLLRGLLLSECHSR